MPAFGQVDAQASVLIVSTVPEAVQGFDVTLPADLFGTQEGGPDLVLRVDVEAVKQQLDVAWKSMLAGMEQFWQATLQQAAEKQGLSSTDKEAMTASVALMQKGLRQFLDDLSWGESSHLCSNGLGLRSGDEDATRVGQCSFHQRTGRPDVAGRTVLYAWRTSTFRRKPAHDGYAPSRNAGAATSITPDARGQAGSNASAVAGAA